MIGYYTTWHVEAPIVFNAREIYYRLTQFGNSYVAAMVYKNCRTVRKWALKIIFRKLICGQVKWHLKTRKIQRPTTKNRICECPTKYFLFAQFPWYLLGTQLNPEHQQERVRRSALSPIYLSLIQSGAPWRVTSLMFPLQARFSRGNTRGRNPWEIGRVIYWLINNIPDASRILLNSEKLTWQVALRRATFLYRWCP